MDVRGFMRAEFVPATAKIELPSLAPWNGGKPLTVTVRGLTGQEFARAKEAAAKNENLTKLFEALAGGAGKEKAKAMMESMGVGDGIPEDLAKRIEMAAMGIVSPAVDLEFCLRLATVFPVDLYNLSNKILELTGAGHTVSGKPAPSTETATSEQA